VTLPVPFFGAGEHVAIDLPGARAVFTTRHGGVSTGPYESLNLGLLTDDAATAVERNRALLSDALGVCFSYIRQVHGTDVLRLSDRREPGSPPPNADGQATAMRDVAPMVMTADCLPIAIAGGGAVAILHAGWRGLAAGVIGEGVKAVRELGTAGALAAAIGPGAGPCCYEVGDEVREAFAAHGAEVLRGANVDLKAIARAQLDTAGVSVVHDVGLCTICSEQFFSHRRDHGVTGRQAGVAWLT
jgi:YfiH family protein